jgi:hypothetical protein
LQNLLFYCFAGGSWHDLGEIADGSHILGICSFGFGVGFGSFSNRAAIVTAAEA